MMTLEPRDDISDKFQWKCRHCNKWISLSDGSFFSKSKLSLQKLAILMYWWVTQYAVANAAEEAEVTETTVCQIYQWLREVCSTKLKPNLHSGDLSFAPSVYTKSTKMLLKTELSHPQTNVERFGNVTTA